MRIYRVETKDAKGPYNGDPDTKAQLRETCPHLFAAIDDCEPRHPVPHNDIPGWYAAFRTPYYFGFTSREQAHAWFNERERDVLRDLGFWLAVYEVPEDATLVGAHQAAFRMRSAKRLTRIQL